MVASSTFSEKRCCRLASDSWIAAKLPAPYPLRFALVRAVVHSAAGQPLAASELASLERQLRAELADPELPARHEGMFRYAVLAYLAQRDGHGGLAATAIHWLQPQLATLSSRKVERMIDLVASALPEGQTMDPAELQRFKREAFLAILVEEEGRLKADPSLIPGLRVEIEQAMGSA